MPTFTTHPSGLTITPNVQVVDPAITKSVNRALELPGDTLEYTITVTNLGTAPALNVAVIDPVPTVLTILNTATTQGTYTIVGNAITYSLGTVNPGQLITIVIVTRVSSSAHPPMDVTNTASLSSLRTASASFRITAGSLPGTGEHPDELPNHAWIGLAILAGVIGSALGVGLFLKRKRSNVKRMSVTGRH